MEKLTRAQISEKLTSMLNEKFYCRKTMVRPEAKLSNLLYDRKAEFIIQVKKMFDFDSTSINDSTMLGEVTFLIKDRGENDEKWEGVSNEIDQIVLEAANNPGGKRRIWGMEKSRITPEATLGRDLGLDDRDLIEILMNIEQKFNIKISDYEIEKILRIKDLKYFAREKLE
jgi:acyl carrier protein